MLLHSLLSAGTYLAAKRALFELSPFEVALARFGLSAVLHAALVLRSRPRIAPRDLAALAALGVLAVPLNQGLLLFGLARSTPGHAALLYALTPIFVFLLARLRLGERATPAKVAGIAVALAGVAVVLLARGLLVGAAAVLGGDLLILGGVASWAIYATAGKRYAQRYGAVGASGVALLLGTAAYLPIGLAASDLGAFARLSRPGWTAVGYLVLLTSVASYVLYSWALARAEASRVAIYANLQPVLTALLAWAAYGERLTPPFVAGGAMVIAGVLLTQRGG
jgi:drug/metabolite transporter (DMT)-like permease